MRSALPHPTTPWSVATAFLVVVGVPLLAWIVIRGLLALSNFPPLILDDTPPPRPPSHAPLPK